MGKFAQLDIENVRICAQCSQQFVLGVDGVLLEGRELCDACAGVTRRQPAGYVIEIHDTPLAVEVE